MPDFHERIRDPVHGLIVFEDDIDRLAWDLINTREFQRLRRIRQLGFSEIVYPGATHTRLAHSIGVYHMARKLLRIIERKAERRPDEEQRTVTLISALLHDIGHGPLSHVFEHTLKELGVNSSHEELGAKIITGDGEIAQKLRQRNEYLPEKVASMLRAETPKDIFGTVVSSQLDADRLDYLLRDRLMTGVQTGRIDIEWILDCLEVGEITVGPESDPYTAPCLYLNKKGIKVAEEYVEARFRLYMTVYTHKTTRAAERMFAALVRDLRKALLGDGALKNALVSRSRIAAYVASDAPTLDAYLCLDDATVGAELSVLSEAARGHRFAQLAAELHNRRLHKCFDLQACLDDREADSQRRRFMRRARELFGTPGSSDSPCLIDDDSVTAYKWYPLESSRALERVFVKPQDDLREPLDLMNVSLVIQALRGQARIYRFYVPTKDDRKRLEQIWEEVGK